jgi:hypothetical protein
VAPRGQCPGCAAPFAEIAARAVAAVYGVSVASGSPLKCDAPRPHGGGVWRPWPPRLPERSRGLWKPFPRFPLLFLGICADGKFLLLVPPAPRAPQFMANFGQSQSLAGL